MECTLQRRDTVSCPCLFMAGSCVGDVRAFKQGEKKRDREQMVEMERDEKERVYVSPREWCSDSVPWIIPS